MSEPKDESGYDKIKVHYFSKQNKYRVVEITCRAATLSGCQLILDSQMPKIKALEW